MLGRGVGPLGGAAPLGRHCWAAPSYLRDQDKPLLPSAPLAPCPKQHHLLPGLLVQEKWLKKELKWGPGESHGDSPSAPHLLSFTRSLTPAVRTLREREGKARASSPWTLARFGAARSTAGSFGQG